jgi:hypothetical protein
MRDLAIQNQSFERLIAIVGQGFSMSVAGHPEQFSGFAVSAGFFDALGGGAYTNVDLQATVANIFGYPSDKSGGTVCPRNLTLSKYVAARSLSRAVALNCASE